MAELAPLPMRLAIYTVALFWGFVTVVGCLIDMVKHGPIKFFKWKKRETRPLCLDDATLGVHSFIRLKNIRLHYVASGPEGKPLMLFLHGFPEFWYSWRHQIRAFNKDYRCVAIDMRGYGESDKPRGVHNYVAECLSEDVKELVLALGYEKCVLVAHDWGGFVAQVFTHFYPSMVQRLILCNIPHPKAMAKHVRGSVKQLLMSWYIFLFQLPYLPELRLMAYDYVNIKKIFAKTIKGSNRSPADADDLEAYIWSLSRPGGLTNPINYYRASLQYKEKQLPKTPITVPTLMIWGVKDHALAKEMAAMSAKYYKDFTLNYVENTGHWVQMEAPDETNTNIREFLSRKKLE